MKRLCMAVHNSSSACCTAVSSRTDRVARKASARCISGFCSGPAVQRRPVTVEAGFVQAVACGETLTDDFQRGVEHRFHQRLADLVPVMGAGKQDEGVGVEVFALIQRRALRHRCCRTSRRVRHRGSAVARNGTARPHALRRRHLRRSGWKTDTAAVHRPSPDSVAVAAADARRPAPRRAAPCRHSSPGLARAARSRLEMLLHRGEQGGQFRRGGGAGNMGHWLASSRQGRLRDMVAERPA